MSEPAPRWHALDEWVRLHCHRCGHLMVAHEGVPSDEDPRYVTDHGIWCKCPGAYQDAAAMGRVTEGMA